MTEGIKMARAADSTRRPAAALTDEQIEAMIAKCSKRAPTGIRNAAILAVMRSTGLRVSELLRLRSADLDMTNDTVRVRHGKGDRSRTVGLGPRASAALARWLDVRKGLGFNGRRAVFCTLKGQPVSDSYVRHMMLRLKARAGMEEGERASPHMLRHAQAIELARRGAGAATIQRALGHSSLAVTDRYLRDLSPQDVIDAQHEGDW